MKREREREREYSLRRSSPSQSTASVSFPARRTSSSSDSADLLGGMSHPTQARSRVHLEHLENELQYC